MGDERRATRTEAAGSACGAGPPFERKVDKDGKPLRFADAYPDALPLLIRLARSIER